MTGVNVARTATRDRWASAWAISGSARARRRRRALGVPQRERTGRRVRRNSFRRYRDVFAGARARVARV